MLEIYSDMKHSYIVELKYAKYKDSETRVEELHREAIAQADRYADTETVKRGIGATRLHKIVVVYKGMEMRICEEVGWLATKVCHSAFMKYGYGNICLPCKRFRKLAATFLLR